MGGERILILVDVSTSMLDKTLVNIFRRRNMSPEQQMRAPKWVQAVNTVDWLTAQIEPGTQVQIIGFNDQVYSLFEGSQGAYLVDGALRPSTGQGQADLRVASAALAVARHDAAQRAVFFELRAVRFPVFLVVFFGAFFAARLRLGAPWTA